MTKKLLKYCLIFLLAIFGTIGTIAWINPWQLVRLDLKNYYLVSTVPQVSKHVVGYGIDIQEAEQVYTALQTFFSVPNINRTVYIYQANPIDRDGAIGVVPLTGVRYVGVYKQDAVTRKDVIVYNGNIHTLYHELTHFFFTHNSSFCNNEIFAQLTVRYLELTVKHTILQQAVKKYLEMIS